MGRKSRIGGWEERAGLDPPAVSCVDATYDYIVEREAHRVASVPIWKGPYSEPCCRSGSTRVPFAMVRAGLGKTFCILPPRSFCDPCLDGDAIERYSAFAVWEGMGIGVTPSA